MYFVIAYNNHKNTSVANMLDHHRWSLLYALLLLILYMKIDFYKDF